MRYLFRLSGIRNVMNRSLIPVGARLNSSTRRVLIAKLTRLDPRLLTCLYYPKNCVFSCSFMDFPSSASLVSLRAATSMLKRASSLEMRADLRSGRSELAVSIKVRMFHAPTVRILEK